MSLSGSTFTAFEQLLAGDMVALARAISILERTDEQSNTLATRLSEYAGQARVIGFTGPPGVGKSTLISAYVAVLRARGQRVAVLAVDPSSPLSGGAILGDRTRMGRHSTDPDVFIRSVAARGHLGGLALSIPAILDAVDAAGWPTIILETVGVGQSEKEIVEFADLKVVLNAPGFGDYVQAMKSGLLEIADVLVVNKSDLPEADRTVQELQAMLELRSANFRNVPILETAAIESDGVALLEQTITRQLASEKGINAKQRRVRRLHGLLRRRAETIFRARLEALTADKMNTIYNRVTSGSVSIDHAAEDLVTLALGLKK